MNRKNMINIRHFLLSFPLLFMACGTSSHQSTRLDPASFEARLNEPDVQLVDARTPGEYAAGHLAGATNLDWNGGRLQATVDQLDKTRPVLVYCASGRRSAEAREFLIEQGFNDVVDLQGGINAWAGAGKAIEH
ncbi:MAG: rhodanese-like domain-containing protein [Flavobacteriales bacterium]|nr:rhodanese-like domain-containing protein [Flavobacteriales bacterium]